MESIITRADQIIFDSHGRAEAMVKKLAAAGRIEFVLALAGTEVSDIDGISAAGCDAASRRLTPALDANILMSNLEDGQSIPVSPRGIASPVVLTRAALSLIPHSTTIIDCGCFTAPSVAHQTIGKEPGKAIDVQDAMSLASAEALYQAGVDLADRIAACASRNSQNTDQEQIVVLAECVPGGTTTAQAVLMALGIPCERLLSSSMPNCNHEQKIALARSALKRTTGKLVSDNLIVLTGETDYFCANPLAAIAAMGDPMQAFAVGFVIRRNQKKLATILAGGSQMLAVYALANQINKNQGATEPLNAAVATTRWVAGDSHANTVELARLVDAPFMASPMQLTGSSHAGLRAYEEGNVKEGVGAGAALLTASLFGIDDSTILQTVDSFYTVLTQ